MKTAISIPDPLFDAAEEVAGHLGLSRSELYARAIAAFVEEYNRHDIKAKLDRIYAEEPSDIDPVLLQMQAASLPRDDW